MIGAQYDQNNYMTNVAVLLHVHVYTDNVCMCVLVLLMNN